MYGHRWDKSAAEANKAGLGWGETATIGSASVLWSAPGATGVALTFDDGPDPRFTPAILDALAERGLTATFLVMGHNAVDHPDLLRQIVDGGHEVGNHGWSHLDLSQCTPEQGRGEILRGKAAIERIVGTAVRWYRPARGSITGSTLKAAAAAGHDIALWSVTAAVSAEQTDGEVRRHLTTEVGPGDVVCMHDGVGRATFQPGTEFEAEVVARRAAETTALPAVLDTLSERGLEMVTLSELAAAGA